MAGGHGFWKIIKPQSNLVNSKFYGPGFYFDLSEVRKIWTIIIFPIIHTCMSHNI